MAQDHLVENYRIEARVRKDRKAIKAPIPRARRRKSIAIAAARRRRQGAIAIEAVKPESHREKENARLLPKDRAITNLQTEKKALLGR